MTTLAVQDASSPLAWNHWRDGYIAFTRAVRSDRSHLKSGAWYEILPLYRDGQRTAYDVFYHRSPFLVSHRFTGSRHSAIGSGSTLARAKALAQMHRNNRLTRTNPLPTSTKLGIGLFAASLAAAGIVLWRGTAKAAAAKPSGSGAVTPAGGTWKHLSEADQAAGGGHTYLLSFTPVEGHSFADMKAELAGSGLTLVGAWDAGQVPAGWPQDDPLTARWRIEFSVPAGVAPQAAAQVTSGLPSPALYELQA